MGIKGQSNRIRNSWTDYLYTVPALVVVLVFLIAPIVFVIYTSFTDWDILHPMKFVGLKNYLKIFTDPVLVDSIKNTLIWVIMLLIGPMMLGLLLAVFIKNVWFSDKIKSIFYIPLAISGAGLGVIWRWIFARTGLLSSILTKINVLDGPRSWLLQVPQSTFAMIMAVTWQATGISMILFLIGLRNIPSDVLEAAKIDGASEWKSFIHIILPLLKSITTIVVILSIIGGFKTFDAIWVMTGGDPGRRTETLAVSMFVEAFTMSHMGYGGAIAVVLSLIVFILGVGYLKIIGRER